MSLLGERNWYLPKWMHRLPDLTHDEAPEAIAEVNAPDERGGRGERVGV